jgi:hypothetical protein
MAKKGKSFQLGRWDIELKKNGTSGINLTITNTIVGTQYRFYENDIDLVITDKRDAKVFRLYTLANQRELLDGGHEVR